MVGFVTIVDLVLADTMASTVFLDENQVVGSGDQEVQEQEHERGFNIFLCESQKWLVVWQSVYYGFWVLASAGNTVALNTEVNSLGYEFFNALDGRTEEEYKAFQSILLAETATFAAAKFIQLAVFCTACVLVRRRYYQQRWTVVSTWLMIVGTIVGSLPLGLWSTAILKFDGLSNTTEVCLLCVCDASFVYLCAPFVEWTGRRTKTTPSLTFVRCTLRRSRCVLHRMTTTHTH